MKTLIIVLFFLGLAAYALAIRHAFESDDPSFAGLCAIVLFVLALSRLRLLSKILPNWEFFTLVFVISVVTASCLSDVVKHRVTLPPLRGKGKRELSPRAITKALSKPENEQLAYMLRDAVMIESEKK